MHSPFRLVFSRRITIRALVIFWLEQRDATLVVMMTSLPGNWSIQKRLRLLGRSLRLRGDRFVLVNRGEKLKIIHEKVVVVA